MVSMPDLLDNRAVTGEFRAGFAILRASKSAVWYWPGQEKVIDFPYVPKQPFVRIWRKQGGELCGCTNCVDAQMYPHNSIYFQFWGNQHSKGPYPYCHACVLTICRALVLDGPGCMTVNAIKDCPRQQRRAEDMVVPNNCTSSYMRIAAKEICRAHHGSLRSEPYRHLGQEACRVASLIIDIIIPLLSVCCS